MKWLFIIFCAYYTCLYVCVVSCVLSHIRVVQGHMHSTAGGWHEGHSLHMRVLRVQLSLNYKSPSSSILRFLLLFFLYPCCPSVPTVFLSPLCPPLSCLSFLRLALYIHDQLCVSSPAFLLYPSHPQISAVPLWHELEMTLIQPPRV